MISALCPSTASSPISPARSPRARPVSPWAARDRPVGRNPFRSCVVPRPAGPQPRGGLPRALQLTRSTPISQAKDIRINEGIRVREVRVVSANGEQLGIMPIAQALETARQQEFDL